MARTIAVLDDEEDILKLVQTHLTRAGFRVETFSRPESFLKYLEHKQPDLILLDLMLPGTDGLEVCRYLKSRPEKSSIPIIMLTARSQEADRVTGLEMGADDYVTKPFSLRELEARIKAVLRRQEKPAVPSQAEKKLAGGQLVINPEKHEVLLKGQPVEPVPERAQDSGTVDLQAGTGLYPGPDSGLSLGTGESGHPQDRGCAYQAFKRKTREPGLAHRECPGPRL